MRPPCPPPAIAPSSCDAQRSPGNQTIQRPHPTHAGFLLAALLLPLCGSCTHSEPKPPMYVHFVVPPDSRGYFVVPRSSELPRRANVTVRVPPNGVCDPIPDGPRTYDRSVDTNGATVPYFFEEPASAAQPLDDLHAIDFVEIEDSKKRGDVFFLRTQKELRASFLDMAGDFVLGLVPRGRARPRR